MNRRSFHSLKPAIPGLIGFANWTPPGFTWLLLLWILLPRTLLAQTAPVTSQAGTFSNPTELFFTQQLDNRSGLSNSAINCIYKDADSLLWIGTWDGLNMYDGSTFHVFNYGRENDLKSIGSNIIQQITGDTRGNIWITTIEGISRYEKRTGRFHNYFYRQHQRSRISEREYMLTVSPAGEVFCLTSREGLTRYDATADSFRTCPIAGITGNIHGISRIAADPADRVWILDDAGRLSACQYKDGRLTLRQTVMTGQSVTRLFSLDGELYYTTPSDQLYRIEGARNHAPESYSPVLLLQLRHTLTAMGYYQGYYLLAWAGKGYGVFDSKFNTVDELKAGDRQMQDLRITSIACGSEQILWLGTDGNGLIKLYPRTKSFGTIVTTDNGNSYNKSVRTFCDVDGSLWYGTKGNGIVAIDRFWSGSHTQRAFLAPQQLDNNSVYALKKGADDLVYIGTDGKGIGVFDQRSGRFFKWQDIEGHEHVVEFGSVYAILPDADRSLWLGTSGYGLIHLRIERGPAGKPVAKSAEQFTFNNSNTGPANDIIYALADGDDGNIWIGCRYGGLSLLDKSTRRFRTFKAFTHEASLSNNDVLSVYKDHRHRIWIGTSYGLNWTGSATDFAKEPSFRKLTTADGLPNNTIHGITEDSLGHIWVSTNRGLAKIETDSLKISHYQQIDGLQSNEFCDGAVWKGPSGQLFFGGTYGFNYFRPEYIQKSAWLPNLLVSDMLMSGKSVMENSFLTLQPNTHLALPFAIERKEDFFELNVKALSYLNAEKCEYAYYLDGYDKIWHYPGTSGKIAYSNISPGNYTLRIKWSNGEGSWTGEAALLQLQVKQFFWLTPWAFLAYGCLLSLIAFIIYNYRKNKLEIRQQLALEHAMRTREEELHRDRISFFTNIAHELQTPLTLIMGSIERFINGNVSPDDISGSRNIYGRQATGRQTTGRPYFLSLIHQQASRLTYLVHQLLEFRKGESGFSNNQYTYLDLSALLTHLTEAFVPMSEQQGKSYQVEIAPGMTGWADKDKIEKIIFNLLSNAFKHSGNKEAITFAADRDPVKEVLSIRVSNSGCHLDPTQLEKLFDKFYTASSPSESGAKFGTGIGLAFTRQLVTLLNGSIHASTEEDRITFAVELPWPVADQHPAETQPPEPAGGRPSYLYRSIMAYPDSAPAISATENNKQAIIENLEENTRRNILIVEDEAEIRYLLKDILKDDYIIYEAEDGLKALELMRRIVPDLIICDVMMPGMDGLELCNKIKNVQSTCHIPFIILSARDTADQHMEGYEVGADAYIAKPFHTAHLKIRIRKLLEHKQKLHEFFRKDNATDALVEADLPENDKQFLTRLVSIIEEHMDQPEFTAANIEKIVSMSKMQLYRRLKTLTGMTPGEFIRHIRLKHAGHLLATTKLTVSEIFLRTGFNNQSYFFREFKKRYHCAPNEYRAQQSIQL